jgi:hypothetical protein
MDFFYVVATRNKLYVLWLCEADGKPDAGNANRLSSFHLCRGSKYKFEVLTLVTGDSCLLGCDALSCRRSLVVTTVSKGPFGLTSCPEFGGSRFFRNVGN